MDWTASGFDAPDRWGRKIRQEESRPPTKRHTCWSFGVKQSSSPGSRNRSIAQVARDLGVSNQTLRNWIK